MRFVYDDTVPDLKEDLATNKFSSLEDVFETLQDDDFFDNLEEYLDHMPMGRVSAQELLDAISHWDCRELYIALLENFVDFLSEDEKTKIINNYKKLFDIPLSYIEFLENPEDI